MPAAPGATVGLRNSKFIGRICIHPTTRPRLCRVLGDIFGPNQERGVYRSRDGGKSWERILIATTSPGAIDLTMDRTNPRLLFASIWEARRNFWNISSGGPGSGLFRSTDGGDTWEEITQKPGLPDGMLGKIGVSISPARQGRVWALVEAEGDKTGLYRSDDFGMRWTMVSPNRDLMHRPWYYTHVFADSQHADTVYVTNLQMWKSTDGGTSFSEVSTRHGDNHDLWIDPNDNTRMIEGNDGGAHVSFNGGASWSTIYNQKTAQFYRIDIDNQYPYRVYGTQQDNTSISVPSASEWGVITLADCSYPGTGESGFIAVDPRDHNVVYVGAIGSSPGGAGALQRYDHRTRQIQLVNVWPEESTGIAPEDLKYRFAWTFPIVFSPHDPGTLYAGGNCVFRSRNEGMSWEAHLARPQPQRALAPGRLGRADHPRERRRGGPCDLRLRRRIAASPRRDLGLDRRRLVHVTRDDGKSWKDVTPKGLPSSPMSAASSLGARSRHDLRRGDALQARRLQALPVQEHRRRQELEVDQRQPAEGRDQPRRARRPGGAWPAVRRHRDRHPFQPGRRRDVAAHDRAAQRPGLRPEAQGGRPGGGDARPLVLDHGRHHRVARPGVRKSGGRQQATRLFAPRTAIRTKLHWSAGANVRTGIAYGPAFGIDGSTVMVERPDGTRVREHLDVGENPPNGAIVWYWLAEEAKDGVTLTFRDSAGRKIATFASTDKDAPRRASPAPRPGSTASSGT
jgi:photosystem II stability/assembly factor-like uncharacterized protein